MDLKLTEHEKMVIVRNTISLFISKKAEETPIFGGFFGEKKINFGLYFAENRHFQVFHTLLRHCDVICWPIFMILVSMKRGDLTLYYGTKQLYFGRVNYGRRVTKKTQEDEG